MASDTIGSMLSSEDEKRIFQHARKTWFEDPPRSAVTIAREILERLGWKWPRMLKGEMAPEQLPDDKQQRRFFEVLAVVCAARVASLGVDVEEGQKGDRCIHCGKVITTYQAVVVAQLGSKLPATSFNETEIVDRFHRDCYLDLARPEERARERLQLHDKLEIARGLRRAKKKRGPT